MKACWANGLRSIVLLALLLGARYAHAQETPPSQSPTATIPEDQKPILATVVGIRVVRQRDNKVLAENPPGLTVEVGKPLNEDEVAASIRTLYLTGDYSFIRVVALPEGSGVRLDFDVRENLFINQVIIEGLKPPPSDSSAVAALQLSLGQTFNNSEVDDALNRLRDTLREEGLYKATVKSELRPHVDTHQMDVIVHVDPGPRVRLDKVTLLNNTEFTDAQLMKLFKLKTGSQLTLAKVQSGTGRLRKFFEKRGYLSARVSARRGDYSESANSLAMSLEVTQGPRVLVTVTGAK